MWEAISNKGIPMNRTVSIEGPAVSLAIFGLVLAVFGTLASYSCLTAPEPRSKTTQLWVTGAAEIIPREGKFVADTIDPRYVGVAPLMVSMNEFQRHAAGRSYIVSFRQEWLTSNVTSHQSDLWKVNYVVRDPETGVLLTSTDHLPWNNNAGWHTETAYDPRTRSFTEYATGRSYVLATIMAVFAVAGFLMIFKGYKIQFK